MLQMHQNTHSVKTDATADSTRARAHKSACSAWNAFSKKQVLGMSSQPTRQSNDTWRGSCKIHFCLCPLLLRALLLQADDVCVLHSPEPHPGFQLGTRSTSRVTVATTCTASTHAAAHHRLNGEQPESSSFPLLQHQLQASGYLLEPSCSASQQQLTGLLHDACPSMRTRTGPLAAGDLMFRPTSGNTRLNIRTPAADGTGRVC